jgi:hypothetical protein
MTTPAQKKRVRWWQHKRNQGTVTGVVGAVLTIAKVGNPIVNLVLTGLGAIWGMIGHVDAEERKTEALVAAAENKPATGGGGVGGDS